MSSLFSYVWPTTTSEHEMDIIPKYDIFDPASIPKNSLIHVCAPGHGGKTSVTLDIIDQFKNKSHVTVFCNDNGMTPGSAKYTEQPVFSFNPQLIGDLLDMNKQVHKLFVFEDTSIEGKNRRNTVLNRLYLNSKNNSVSIFTNQYVLDLPKCARDNVTHVFTRPSCSANNQSVFNNYGKWCFSDYSQFLEALNGLNNFEYLVLRKNGDIYTYTPNKRN